MSERDHLEFWTRALNLPDFHVVHEARTTPDEPVCFTVRPKQNCALCPRCHAATDLVHRTTSSKRVKDLPLGSQAVDLIVRTHQFRCPDCDLYFTPHYAAFAPGAHATERFLQQAAKLIRFSDIQNAALFVGVSATTLARWYYAYTERLAQNPPAKLLPITHLGIDEISQKKKYRQFVLVLIDHTNGRTLEVLADRDKDTLVKWLQQAKRSGLLAQLVEVTTDMWEGYVNAVHEVFGTTVRVTIDRFHVMKQFQERLTEARREIQRRLPKEQATALKGSRWLWLKNFENLTQEEQERLQELKKRFPQLKALAEARESLREIFEDRGVRSVEEGKEWLRAWMQHVAELGLKALQQFAQTLTRWLEGIANYFATRSSNGRTEGFNHAFRSILWRAFGMQNFSNFRQRVLDRFGRAASL